VDIYELTPASSLSTMGICGSSVQFNS